MIHSTVHRLATFRTKLGPVRINSCADEAGLQPRHKPWLDGWRGIAILVVVLGHLLDIPGKPARFGVELFFVLSGRLMAELLFVQKQPIGYFLKRRVARVWPALYVFVLIMAVAFAAPGPHQLQAHHIIGALTYTFNYVRIITGPAEVLDHVWSLCVEEWAYLFLAILAVLTRRWKAHAAAWILAIAALCAVNGLIQTMLGGTYRDVYWQTDVRIASIFVACGLYLILRNKALPVYLPIAAGLIGTMFHSPIFPEVVKYTIGTFFLAISVATIDIAPRPAIRILASKPLILAGLWSYSIYLWQQPFTKVMEGWSWPVQLALLMMAALTSFYLVEQPARRYLQRVWANRSAPSRTDEPELVRGGPAL